jgi:tripeptide aminopeptidase
MNTKRLLERFLRYVQIDTTARDGAEGYPSSAGQLELGRLLVGELRAMGIADAQQDANGIVLATIPPTVVSEETGTVPVFVSAKTGLSPSAAVGSAEKGTVPFSLGRKLGQSPGRKLGQSPVPPTIALCAHLDTSPETTGAGIRPQVIENYAGGDIRLPGDPTRVIRTAESPELDALRGGTIITSDGTTLLGADDKAGVAVIMETAAWLVEHPEIAHGRLRLCFTCDEEIGRGCEKLSLPQIDAAVCYTLDGHAANMIDVETFSADLAVVTVRGVNIHPSIAKGRMVNAVRAAADFIARLPRDRLSPETTDGRDGFLHPYEIDGGVAETRLRILLRDFDAAKLDGLAERLRQSAAVTMQAFPGATIDVSIKRQYRNMAEGLAHEPRAVALAQRALERLGRKAELTIVRGGTDGSRLTEMGLPTPNLSCGAHNPHSPLEWACLEQMAAAVEGLVALAEEWGKEG